MLPSKVVTLRVLALIVLTVLLSGAAQAQTAYHATNILGPVGSSDVYASGLNYNGVVVGNYHTVTHEYHAFRWTPNVVNGKTGTFEDLHPAGAMWSAATSVNDYGEIVGYAIFADSTIDGFRMPAFRTAILIPDDLFSVLGREVIPTHINNNGVVVGYLFDNFKGYSSFRLGSGSHSITAAELFGPNTMQPKATWVNNNGVVCGYEFPDFAHTFGILSVSGQTLTRLGVFGTTVLHSSMYAVNDANHGIGYFMDNTKPYPQGFIAPVDREVIPSNDVIPTVFGNGSIPTAINNLDVVVGYEIDAGFNNSTYQETFRYDTNGPRAIKTLVDESVADTTLSYPNGINDKGQIIVLGNRPSGASLSLLLTPTAPFQLFDTFPRTIQTGSGDTQIKIMGYGYVPNSKVKWNAHLLATTYVSDEVLMATVPAAYLKSTSGVNVNVVNPSGKISNPAPVKVLGLFKSLSVTPITVGGGSAATGTIMLNFPAPVGDLAVQVTSNSSSATPPPSITVPAGLTTYSFAIPTNPVVADTQAIITVIVGAESKHANLIVKRSLISMVSFDKTMVRAGNTALGTISLTGPAPTGGLVVVLTSSKAALTVPDSVTVPAGQTTATFSATGNAVAAKTSVVVTAKTGTVSKTVQIAVTP